MIPSNKIYILPFFLFIFSITLPLKVKAVENDSIFSKLNLEEKIGQLIFALPHQNNKTIKVLGRENKLGGVIFDQYCSKNTYTYFKNLNKLPNKIPVLLGATSQNAIHCLDQNFKTLPDQYHLSAIGSNIFTYSTYHEIGKISKKLNLDFYLSNTLAIQTQNGKPSYGFGDDPKNVMDKNHASLKGLHQADILVGTTIPENIQFSTLQTNEQLVFQQLLKDSINIIRPSDVLFDASLFDTAFIRLLSDSIHYQGLIFSGDLSAGANIEATQKNAIKAIKRGHDVLVLSNHYIEVIKAIKSAIKQGELSEEEIDLHLQKIISFKNKKDTHLIEYTNSYDLDAIRSETNEKSITVLSNLDSIIPLKDVNKSKYQLISIGARKQDDTFASTMTMFIDYDYHRIEHASFSTAQVNLLLEACKKKETVIVNIICHQESSKHRYGVSYATQQLIEQLQQKTDVIVVLNGSPHGLKYLNKARNIILNYSTTPYAQKANAQLIAGALSANGKLPININDHYKVGQGISISNFGRLGYGKPEQVGLNSEVLNHLIDSIANNAIYIEATPGCQVVIAKNGKIVFEKAYGYFTYEKEVPVTNQTVYDIASVTKVASTTQAMMMLDYKDSINVNKSLDYYLPSTDTTNKGDINLIQFLTHTAPLKGGYYFWGHAYDKETKKYNPTYLSPIKKKGFTIEVTPDLYATDSIKDCMWKWLLESPISTRRRYTKNIYRYWYSDLGYYFLQRVIEKQAQMDLDLFMQDSLYDPLGTRTLGYHPLKRINVSRIPPTEMDINYRQSLIKGFVHDPSADLMGGVGGHAGVFSNAHDLAILMQMNLQRGTYGDHIYFDDATLKKYNRQPYKGFKNRRALGWDKPPLKGDEGNTAKEAPKATFGHTGFTGTCAWVDPKNQLVYIFLSNRVYPTARNNKLAKENVRENIQSAIYKAMEKSK